MRGSRTRFFVGSAMGILLCVVAAAHSSLGEYVQHRYLLSVSPENIDLTVELAFNGGPARTERLTMDTDHDGVIDRDERKAWLAGWEKSGTEQIRLLCKGEAIPVLPQYEPELDLQDDRGTGEHPFVLRLSFFARTPKNLVPGDPLRVESRIKSDVPALVAVEVGGDAVGSFAGRPGRGISLPALKAGGRSFDVPCPKFSSRGVAKPKEGE